MRQDALTQALYSNYQRAGRDTKYWGFYFLRQLKNHGGLETAKRILRKSGKAGETKGFLALLDAGRPDLSVEAVVLLPQFRHLFTAEEIAIAEKRLRRFPSSSWRKTVNPTKIYPDELPPNREFLEGGVKKVQVKQVRARSPCTRSLLGKERPAMQCLRPQIQRALWKDWRQFHSRAPPQASRYDAQELSGRSGNRSSTGVSKLSRNAAYQRSPAFSQ